MNTIQYLLINLIEECAEVQKSASKAMRFNMDTGYLDSTNRKGMEKRLADMLAIVELLEDQGILNHSAIVSAMVKSKKKDRVSKYLLDCEQILRA
jgi:hypothetical protein